MGFCQHEASTCRDHKMGSTRKIVKLETENESLRTGIQTAIRMLTAIENDNEDDNKISPVDDVRHHLQGVLTSEADSDG